MGLIEGLLSPWLVVLTGLFFLLGLGQAFRYADWQRLRRDPALQHSFFGAAVILGFFWQLRAGLSPGLTIHIFAMTTVTLMLGWALAIYAGLIALVISAVIGSESIPMFGATALMTVMIPALVSHSVMLYERRHFKHFFAYIFVCSFFGAAIAVAVAGCLTVGMLWLSDAYSWYELVHDYLRYLPLILLPEAVINGMVVTGLMVFHPDRLLTLDVRRYD